jgi:hypothetical protein
MIFSQTYAIENKLFSHLIEIQLSIYMAGYKTESDKLKILFKVALWIAV